MLQGYKTWIGIVITLLGTLGVLENLGVTGEQVSNIADVVFQLIGLLVAAYGNYDAHKRLEEVTTPSK